MSTFAPTVYDHVAFTALIGSVSFYLIAHGIRVLSRRLGRSYDYD